MKISIIAVIITFRLFLYSFSANCNSEAPPNCQVCGIWIFQLDKCMKCNPGYYLSNKGCKLKKPNNLALIISLSVVIPIIAAVVIFLIVRKLKAAKEEVKNNSPITENPIPNNQNLPTSPIAIVTPTDPVLQVDSMAPVPQVVSGEVVLTPGIYPINDR